MTGRKAMAALWNLVQDMREQAVWRHEIDGQLIDDKVRPFFIAVEPNWYRFESFRMRSLEVEKALQKTGRPTVWVPKVVNQSFERIGYNQNAAFMSRPLKMQQDLQGLHFRSEERIDNSSLEEYLAHLQQAQRAFRQIGVTLHYDYRLYQEYVLLQFHLQSPQPLRRSMEAGHKFRVWGYAQGSNTQVQLGGGAILVRGVGEVYEAKQPRKPRPREKTISLLGWNYKIDSKIAVPHAEAS